MYTPKYMVERRMIIDFMNLLVSLVMSEKLCMFQQVLTCHPVNRHETVISLNRTVSSRHLPNR